MPPSAGGVTAAREVQAGIYMIIQSFVSPYDRPCLSPFSGGIPDHCCLSARTVLIVPLSLSCTVAGRATVVHWKVGVAIEETAAPAQYLITTSATCPVLRTAAALLDWYMSCLPAHATLAVYPGSPI